MIPAIDSCYVVPWKPSNRSVMSTSWSSTNSLMPRCRSVVPAIWCASHARSTPSSAAPVSFTGCWINRQVWLVQQLASGQYLTSSGMLTWQWQDAWQVLQPETAPMRLEAMGLILSDWQLVPITLTARASVLPWQWQRLNP